MIDLKDYRENPEKYIVGAENKSVKIDWELFNQLDEQVKELKLSLEEMLAKRNSLSKQVQELQKNGEDFLPIVSEVKELKEEIQKIQTVLDEKESEFVALLLCVPNPSLAEVPIGSEKENKVIEKIGEKPVFDFEPKCHRDLLEAKGYLDMERGVKLSGSRFVLVKGKLAELQMALQYRVTKKLIAKGFTFTYVPQMVQEGPMKVTGYLPDAENGVYVVNPNEDDYYLIGTSEVPLIGQHQDEFLAEEELPIRYAGFSSCFRREAGSYGKDTKGLIRLHQFEKVEMVSFVKPEDSAKEHDFLFAIENEIFTELGLHYQQILIASGDLGAPAAKKFDIEAWFPGIGDYKEVTSTSNTTDFQARRGNIKVKGDTGKYFVHTLNGTALALGRALACLVETYQTADGDIRVPDVLKPFMSDEIL